MSNKVYAIDFGTGNALQIWGPDGPISKSSLALPRVPGGKRPCDEFILILGLLLKDGDVVVESPTPGSGGRNSGSLESCWRLPASASHGERPRR